MAQESEKWPGVTFFVESREESARCEKQACSISPSRGRFLLDRLAMDDVKRLLKEMRAGISLALNQTELKNDAAIIEFMQEYGRAGIGIDLWPNLPDEDGYWIHAGNIGKMRCVVADMINRLDRNNVNIRRVGLDLELPLGVLQGSFIRSFLREKPWRLPSQASRIELRNAVYELFDRGDHGYSVDLYEIPILSDSPFLRGMLGMVEVPEDGTVTNRDPATEHRARRVGMVYTSLKPPIISARKFVRKYSVGRGRLPALGIVSATQENPGRDLGKKPVHLLTRAEFERDMMAALEGDPEQVYVFALNGLPVIERTREAIRKALEI